MSRHFHREIELLKKKLLAVSAVVEECIAKAIAAVMQHDAALAHEVIEGDDEVDQMEVDVEEDCVLKINNDLERMADLGVNIARRAEYLAAQPKFDVPANLEDMARATQTMVKHSLDALVQSDTELARQVCAADNEVDHYNRQMHVLIQDQIRTKPEQVERLIHLLSVSRHLERIADLATNVAEDVIYTVEGDIVRHRTPSY